MPGNHSGVSRVVAVGACYIDTILRVPHFPAEDSKLRTINHARRRGGNCPNVLEVLQQLICHRQDKLEQVVSAEGTDEVHDDNLSTAEQVSTSADVDLHLLSVLPASTSMDTNFIKNSFNMDSLVQDCVDLENCIYRPETNEAGAAYIISSQASGSRTIISRNEHLSKMSFTEFKMAVEAIHAAELSQSEQGRPDSSSVNKNKCNPSVTSSTPSPWYHFEGRDSSTIALCIRYLRHLYKQPSNLNVCISVELENPAQPGLEDIEILADVVFYSRSWAVAQGYTDAKECIQKQAVKIRDRRHAEMLLHEPRDETQLRIYKKRLFCMWGTEGAAGGWMSVCQGWKCKRRMKLQVTDIRPAWSDLNVKARIDDGGDTVVDSVGAGDSWVAGMLYALMFQIGSSRRCLTDVLAAQVDFANRVAGRKVMREGFGGIGLDMWDQLLR